MVIATTADKPVITAAAFDDVFTTVAFESIVVTAADEVFETSTNSISQRMGTYVLTGTGTNVVQCYRDT